VNPRIPRPVVRLCLIAGLGGVLHAALEAQDRLKSMPGYARYEKMSREIPSALKSGGLAVTWTDPRTIEYSATGSGIATTSRRKWRPNWQPAPRKKRQGAEGAADQRAGASSIRPRPPDGKSKASYHDRNLWLSDATGGGETALTTDGSEKTRIKYGTASWVYGEELSQTTAMWWSPDSSKIAYYRFDESKVPDYFLQTDQTKIQSTVDTEAYPKAGAPNPVVDLFVYDLATKKTTRIDVRDGKPFDNSVVGHYVYHIAWSSDGTELLFNRTNRRQNVLEFTAANPSTERPRVIVHEEWPTGWIENNPSIYFLKDGRRFIWESSRNGWTNFYLYDLSGTLITPLTSHTSFEAANVIKIDEAAAVMYYYRSRRRQFPQTATPPRRPRWER
jgi:dipeptidyl-peptidase-4